MNTTLLKLLHVYHLHRKKKFAEAYIQFEKYLPMIQEDDSLLVLALVQGAILAYERGDEENHIKLLGKAYEIDSQCLLVCTLLSNNNKNINLNEKQTSPRQLIDYSMKLYEQTKSKYYEHPFEKLLAGSIPLSWGFLRDISAYIHFIEGNIRYARQIWRNLLSECPNNAMLFLHIGEINKYEKLTINARICINIAILLERNISSLTLLKAEQIREELKAVKS